MAIQPPGGAPPQQPPQSQDFTQIATHLNDQLSQFIESVKNIMNNPHLADGPVLDVVATNIENLYAAAAQAARVKEG